MYSKIILFGAILCVANASVMTINVYDDTNGNHGEGVSDCDLRGCEQLCRRLGFPGGACINGRCKCDNFKTDQGSELGVAVSKLSRECDLSQCKTYCWSIGFITGICYLDEFCICKYPKPNPKPQSELLESRSLGSCEWNSCYSYCRTIGFLGGYCFLDTCMCKYPKPKAEMPIKSADLTFQHGCHAKSCANVCSILGIQNGSCVNNKCKCLKEEDPNINNESTTKALENSSVKQEQLVKGNLNKPVTCDPTDCSKKCLLSNHLVGECSNNDCVCY
ncbi:uncharacterized protein LOC142974301 isoform X2 [Anticarsia gemmatalis]|uniref:uncharacterized protein LOC142974301 isoform X2 n=1 Tax=Anticarsia gemmatalis TaxID=129554 RepID=UPI003F763A09